LFASDKNGNPKTAIRKKYLFKNIFLSSKALFFELFRLVSSVNLFEVYCKKRKKSEKFFLHTENGGVRRSGYTYRNGYTYRASCRTVPIFKAGNSDLCDNYRPISLLSPISKILEKLIAIQLTNHLELNNLLYQHQYGFQRNKSTLHNLTHLTNYIYSALNDKKYCIGLFLDLCKAFDGCSHSVLFKKLRKYGIHGTTYDWFASYLKDRKQQVDIDGNLSSASTFNISVIQGSILGHILFLIHINDLYNASDLFKTHVCR
jgi:hypothetical protein